VNSFLALNDLAVIIPLAPGDNAWIELLKDLKELPEESEIILVATDEPDTMQAEVLNNSKVKKNLHWVISEKGRAVQQNNGVAASTKNYFWFLHADSRLQLLALETVEECLKKRSDAIFYFDLDFMSDGPAVVKLNAYGARIRSRFLGLPFGDQGLFMSREVFTKLGGFPEEAPFGEDHLLVWKAKALSVPLLSTRKKIFTSARKYKENGWAKTTAMHIYLTAKQALPEKMKQVREKWFT